MKKIKQKHYSIYIYINKKDHIKKDQRKRDDSNIQVQKHNI